MLSDEFAEMIAPFRLLANRKALSPIYRSLQFDEHQIKGCAGYAILSIVADFNLPAGRIFYVDAFSFIAVISSLPPKKEVELSLVDNTLSWKCGTAKGRLALSTVDAMPEIAFPDETGSIWEAPPEFTKALEVGSISCGNESLSSIGMYGVVIDNRDDLCIYSSDNITISAAWVHEGGIPDAPPLMVLSPDATALLSSLLKLNKKEAILAFDANSIYYQDENRSCMLKRLAPLKHDISQIMAAFSGEEVMVDLPVDRLGAFIKRIGAIAESKKANFVTLGASKGRLSLDFSDGMASTEEYYLVDSLEVPDLPPIKIDAVKVSRALAHVERIALDHIDRNVLVFRGDDPICKYIITGRARSEQ